MAHCDLSYMRLFLSSRFVNSGWCNLVLFTHGTLAIACRDSNRSQMPFSVCSHSCSDIVIQVVTTKSNTSDVLRNLSCLAAPAKVSFPNRARKPRSLLQNPKIWDCDNKLIHCSACDALVDHDLHTSIHSNRSPSRKLTFRSEKKEMRQNVFHLTQNFAINIWTPPEVSNNEKWNPEKVAQTWTTLLAVLLWVPHRCSFPQPFCAWLRLPDTAAPRVAAIPAATVHLQFIYSTEASANQQVSHHTLSLCGYVAFQAHRQCFQFFDWPLSNT